MGDKSLYLVYVAQILNQAAGVARELGVGPLAAM